MTTDLAELRPDGCHLFGRSSDAVNLAGRKVHPAELESLLRQHPAVRECLVFSVPSTDPERGEELVACVARATPAGIDGRHLSDWLAPQVAAWKIPRHWWMCDELRANARGKLSRRRVAR